MLSKFKEALVAAALLLGLTAVGWGLVRHGDTIDILWLADGRRAVAFGLASGATVALAALWLRRPLRWALVVLLLVVSASAVGLGPVAAALLLLAGATQLGLLISPEDAEAPIDLRLVMSCALGLACYAALLEAGSRLPVHYPLLYLALAGAPFLMMPVRARAFWRRLQAALGEISRVKDWWNAALWSVAIAGVLIRWLGALAPEVGMDALSMHLVMPAAIARDHQWLPAESGFVWAWIPKAANWIYALAYLPAGEAGARLVNFAADALVLLGCAGAARQAGGLRAGAIAAALYGSAPIGYLLTTSLFVENLWTLWLGSALLLGTWMRARPASRRMDLLLGLLFGAALAAKAMTVFAAPIFLFLFWEKLRRDRGAAIRSALVTAAAGIVVGGWPYAVAWLDTGNPVFPFMNSIFASSLYPSATSFDNPLFKHEVGPRTLYDITFVSGNYVEAFPGAFGLLWLALLPAGLVASIGAGGRWSAVLALGSLVFMAAVFHFQSYLRYIAPLYPLWAVLIAVSLTRLRPALVASVCAITLLGGLAGLVLHSNSTWHYRSLPPQGPVDPSNYRRWKAMARPEAAIVNRANELGVEHVLWLGHGYYAGLNARVTTNSWHQQAGWEKLKSLPELRGWMSRHQFDAVAFAADFDPCANPLHCEYFGGLGKPELVAGTARLYLLDIGMKYPKELLGDPDLDGDPKAWVSSGGWEPAMGTMKVDVLRVASQPVGVSPGRKYLYTIRARCESGPALYRLQVSWMAADGQMIEPTIDVRTCDAEWKTEQLVMASPARSATAVVYASGHESGKQVLIDHVSFKE